VDYHSKEQYYFYFAKFIFYKMVENCQGGSGYSAETQGRFGFKGLMTSNVVNVTGEQMLLKCKQILLNLYFIEGVQVLHIQQSVT